ncbi:hypothetical protein [Rhodospirillaceae bacterium SYSU D60014]|uniref:baeRF3 domain-containing protein n=1 Tax=Virgifigura deserti TaxID=2268457 RepID=UPI000E67620C
MLTKDDLGRLMTADATPAVSIFLPTHIAGREVRQDPIRLKDLLGEAARQLTETGLRGPEADQILAPALELVEDYTFWRHQDRGLALFLAPGIFHRYRVPIDLPELVVVAKRFHVKPLLTLLAADGLFFVLAVTAGKVRLFEASRFGMAECDDVDLPDSVAAISGETDYQNMLHASPVARPRTAAPVGIPKTHNFGEDPEEQRKAQLVEFIRRVSRGVEDYLDDTQASLVLAAEPEIEGHFRKIYKPKHLLPKGVEINPDALDMDDLHRRAYALVRPEFTKAREEAVGQFQTLCGNGDSRAETRVDEIVKAARFGRVDTLFVAADARCWGRFDETANQVALQDSATADNEDLLDYAAVQTLVQGGQVNVMDKGDLPRGDLAAAILRY